MVGAFLISIMMSVGQGLENFLLSQVTTFSSEETISVSKSVGMADMFGFGGEPREYDENSSQTLDSASLLEQSMLTKDDLDKINDIDGVVDAGFQIIISTDYIQLGDDGKKYNISLYGFPAGVAENITYYDVDYDLLDRDDAITISGDYADSWDLSNDDIVGKTVIIQIPKDADETGLGTESKIFEFIVAGVTEKSLIGQMGMVGTDAAYEIGAYRTGSTPEEYENNLESFEIDVLVKNADMVEEVDKAIEDLGYEGNTIDEMIGQIGTIFDIIGYVLSGFGGIALFVASIGIINTLLMAIYERTREIGVMVAVGAKRVFVGIMFTFEGALLGFIGGGLGLLASWGFGNLANNILHNGIIIGDTQILEAYLADYPTFNVSVITLWLVCFVIITTTVVSWIASIYPAWKASRLDPIQALRHD
jgi:putative ABC transport system permease protein